MLSGEKGEFVLYSDRTDRPDTDSSNKPASEYERPLGHQEFRDFQEFKRWKETYRDTAEYQEFQDWRDWMAYRAWKQRAR